MRDIHVMGDIGGMGISMAIHNYKVTLMPKESFHQLMNCNTGLMHAVMDRIEVMICHETDPEKLLVSCEKLKSLGISAFVLHTDPEGKIYAKLPREVLWKEGEGE